MGGGRHDPDASRLLVPLDEAKTRFETQIAAGDNSHVVLYPAVGDGDAVWATDTFYKSGQLVHWIPPEQRRTF